jgi:hypothetical protein
MQLSLKELNELIYCVGTVMSSKTNTYGAEDRTALYEKLTTDLESRVNDLVELERAPKKRPTRKELFGVNRLQVYKSTRKTAVTEITEMPRYVKCIDSYGNAEVGAIYNTSDYMLAYRLFRILSWEQVLLTFGNLKGVHNQVLHPRFESVDWDGNY